MKILCVAAVESTRRAMEELAGTALPSAEITAVSDGETARYEISRSFFAVALTETGENGLRLAREIHEISPDTKVIFITAEERYALPAYKTRASGYLLLPLEPKDLFEELSDLGVVTPTEAHRVEAVTFGNFDLLCDGVSVHFKRSKSKELLAYLIDRRGTPATSSELIVNLWEDKDVDRSTRSMLHSLVSDIKKTLTFYGISELFETQHNSFKINEGKFSCDYYELLRKGDSADRRFTGEYMTSYSWAEMTTGVLAEMTGVY